MTVDFEALARHRRIALSCSGGKDSLACLYLLRDYLPKLTVYHMDTGDLLPETQRIVEHIWEMAPNFVHVRSDVAAWIAKHGLPTDLLPHSAHPIGQVMGEGPRLVARYTCCAANLMAPLHERIVADGNTLIIRGTKLADMHTLPIRSGEVQDGIEYYYPLQRWSDAAVLRYLSEVGAPINRVYTVVPNSPECARCPAWWGERRASYLKRYHPELWRDYAERLRVVSRAIAGPLANLRRECAELQGVSE